ncbi:MAG TPA: LD-carboxypeptidase [Rickettsia endosymbiont of Proechinophthirus fluctus]|uniref:LD-carboxypeptidase n=1 Tax=Rickettsia endosymbiont of Proechinophthirus fluctus TaxID=1462733 RepID=UPI000789FB7E|nr:LD-carboxypeptidase [Rickettsia endosymbiont of Proechinophthirus fluctus]KYP98065.1 peptidase S66 [Rickettsia endosymbiont of Proechinophthirus fluctus]HJD54510.1 LD-carboxypeptidase [Rickettsia endosymbiont of Proechinophthirus fluctus]
MILKNISLLIILFFSISTFSAGHSLKNISITVVAPATGADNKTLSDLKNINGLNLQIASKCFAKGKLPFLASSDEVRFNCLRDALFDESDNIVWSLRGGYGSARIIPDLLKLSKPKKEKFFVGYSDITALHLFLSQEWGWKTIHGSNIADLLKPEQDQGNFTKLAEILKGKVKQVTIDNLVPLNDIAKSSDLVNGTLTGGNLTMVQTSIGTSWQIKTKGKILFLEDVNVVPFRLDRELLHLKQAGLLEDVKAIIFGSFGKDFDATMLVLRNFADSLDIPVFKTNRFGHEKINDPIIYNTNSKIIKSKEFKLVMGL